MSLFLKNTDKIEKNVKCYFCGDSHICRDCPKEIAMAPIFKKKIGNMMEFWFANNFSCPECNNKSLNVVGNHSPSLDIICQNCNKKFEVKSKCLSINKLPDDIKLPHGSYIDFNYRLNNGLNLIVIIYGVDRINKIINIREIIYANNSNLRNKDIIKVDKKNDSNLSIININDKNKLEKLNMDTQNIFLSFKNEYDITLSKNGLEEKNFI